MDKKPNKKDRKKYMDKSRKIHNNKIGSNYMYYQFQITGNIPLSQFQKSLTYKLVLRQKMIYVAFEQTSNQICIVLKILQICHSLF